MSKGDNENPDGGFDHFHEHGRKKPMSLAKNIPEKRAMNSGPHTMGAPEGMDPDVGKMPVTNMEGWHK